MNPTVNEVALIIKRGIGISTKKECTETIDILLPIFNFKCHPAFPRYKFCVINCVESENELH